VASLSDVAASIEATRASVEAVGGPINSSKGQAEHTVAAMAGLGVEGVSARMRQAIDRIEEAESIRAALEGALVKAQFQVMSAIHGTMGPGARGSTSSVFGNDDGTTSWHGTIDGIKTEIRYGEPRQPAPDPSGQNLLDEARPRKRFSAFSQTAVKEDATDAAKPFGQLFDHAQSIYQKEASPPTGPTSTGEGFIAEVRHDTAVFQAIPAPQATMEQLSAAGMVIALVGMKTTETVAAKMTKVASKFKERKRNDQE
jgi:hypothetical protein